MKILLIIISFFLSTLFASTELSWVDEQVQAIKPARDGMHKRELSRIKDPFIFLKKNRGKEEKKTLKQNQIVAGVKPQNGAKKTVTAPNTYRKNKRLTLEAIMNNSVMINGTWYKLQAHVHGYIVSHVTRNSVLLTKNKKSLLLTTKTLNTNIKFQK